MTRRHATALMLAQMLAVPARAAAGEVVSLGHGVAWRRGVSGPAGRGWFQVITFDSSRAGVEVVAQEKKDSALPLDRLLMREQAIAGCNGGYFEPAAFTPAGLQVAGGLSTGKYQPFGEWGGGFGVRGGVPQIWTEPEMIARGGFDGESFVQCSPVLVDGRRRFGGGGEDVEARRTFIAHDGGTRWAMGVTSRLGLKALAGLLDSEGRRLVGFVVHRALNLDGGPSSGLWARDEQGRVVVHEKEMWAVKNGVAIRPLKK